MIEVGCGRNRVGRLLKLLMNGGSGYLVSVRERKVWIFGGG